MADAARLVGAGTLPEDSEGPAAGAIRPERLADFVGQARATANLDVFIAAATARGRALDHVLIAGPPGLGKTTLAQIIARELAAGFRATSGPVITKGADLAALLTNLEARDVLFIDEIHRLSPAVEEILYPAMEDFVLDLMIGEGPSARSVRIDLPPFTLIGATTRAGRLTMPLRDRFGIPLRLEFYGSDELAEILIRQARRLGIGLDGPGALEIASRARGTPRIAGRLLRRVEDFAVVAKVGAIDRTVARAALDRLEIDALGLDSVDHRYLRAIAETFSGGPVGLETLSAYLSEPKDTLEDVVEPFLLQQGMIQRTPRGRVLISRGYEALGLPAPAAGPATAYSDDLFTDEATA